MKKLTPKQRLFVHEYLIDLNGAQAASRAGYSRKTARFQASRLLALPQIKKAVQVLIEKRESSLIMTRDEILRELSIVGRADLANYIEINDDTGAIRAKGFAEMPAGTSRGLEMIREDRMIREDSKGDQSIINEKITFKMHNKLGALELLGRHEGLFPTKIEGDLTIRAKLSLEEFKKSIKEVQDAGSGG